MDLRKMFGFWLNVIVSGIGFVCLEIYSTPSRSLKNGPILEIYGTVTSGRSSLKAKRGRLDVFKKYSDAFLTQCHTFVFVLTEEIEFRFHEFIVACDLFSVVCLV